MQVREMGLKQRWNVSEIRCLQVEPARGVAAEVETDVRSVGDAYRLPFHFRGPSLKSW
jgi:hypothetical protein